MNSIAQSAASDYSIGMFHGVLACGRENEHAMLLTNLAGKFDTEARASGL
jgi:hypothetical protein